MFCKVPAYLLWHTESEVSASLRGRAFHNKSAAKHPPELDVEHGDVREICHALDVQDLLDLGSALDDGLHGFGVDVQLWRRRSRFHPLGAGGRRRRPQGS